MFLPFCFIIFIKFAISGSSENTSEILDISELLKNFQVKGFPKFFIIIILNWDPGQVGYDRRVRPNYGGPPVSVGVSLYVLNVGEISYKFMDFTFDMYFRWNLSDWAKRNWQGRTKS